MPVTVFDHRGKAVQPKIKSGDPLDAFVGELRHATTAVARNEPSAILNGELARDALLLCQKQTQSLRTGRVVKV